MLIMPGKADIPRYHHNFKKQLGIYTLLLLVTLLCFSLPAWAQASTFQISVTSDIQNQHTIPLRFSRLHGNQTPTIQWQNAPANTVSFAVTMTDPDATNGLWIHWIAYNIPATATKITNYPANYQLGINSWGNKAYDGPQPPSGTHHYVITLYALSKPLSTSAPLNYEQFQKATKSITLASTQIISAYTEQ